MIQSGKKYFEVEKSFKSIPDSIVNFTDFGVWCRFWFRNKSIKLAGRMDPNYE